MGVRKRMMIDKPGSSVPPPRLVGGVSDGGVLFGHSMARDGWRGCYRKTGNGLAVDAVLIKFPGTQVARFRSSNGFLSSASCSNIPPCGIVMSARKAQLSRQRIKPAWRAAVSRSMLPQFGREVSKEF